MSATIHPLRPITVRKLASGLTAAQALQHLVSDEVDASHLQLSEELREAARPSWEHLADRALTRLQERIDMRAQVASAVVRDKFRAARKGAEWRHTKAQQAHRAAVVRTGVRLMVAAGDAYKPHWPQQKDVPEIDTMLRHTSGSADAVAAGGERWFWPIAKSTAAGVLFFALVLGWLGPALDGLPDRREEWLLAEELRTTIAHDEALRAAVAQWEAEARQACARLTGENGTYVRLAGGGVQCLDKRGRKAKGAL